MKFGITLFFCLLATASFGHIENTLEKPKVDERVEILSIVFRLAECSEYNSESFKLYTAKIQEHYGPYKEHELIQFIRDIRSKNGVGFDAVMSMAVHLDDSLNPKTAFTDKIPDARWGKDNANEFVKLLKKFYWESQSKQFFENNRELYTTVSQRFFPVYEHLDLDWYTRFYGKEPNEQFIIVNGLGNGGGNYGPSVVLPDGRRAVYAIMGTWETDSTGMAAFSLNNYFPTLLHEFNHSFVNYLLEKQPEPFRKYGEHIYNIVGPDMHAQAYGNWQTMLNEALVRSAVIKYMKDHRFADELIQEETSRQLSRGFLWINELVAELEKYDSQRNKYPTLESYLPHIVKAYEIYARNINSYVKDFDDKRPHIVSIDAFKNGDQNVSRSLRQVTISFNKPLAGQGYSINYARDENAFPDFKKIRYSDDKKSVIVEWELQENKAYAFVLTGLSFKSQEGIPIKDYEINFKTR